MEFPGNERYEVLERLGQGGMGTVFAAFDRRRQRKLAVKVLRDPERGSLFRFKKEFRATAGLRHPNLIRLYDLGTLDSGAFFFTMELVVGQDLATWVRTRPRVGATVNVLAETVPEGGAATQLEQGDGAGEPADVARVLLGVVSGLRYLHAAQKVHRDLKPSNVLVPADGQAKLLDFGILGDLDADSGLTAGDVVGTPLYMSPEQVSGAPLTPAVDLYALGCVLYELLTGKPPFVGSPAQVLLRHLHEAPRPPAERAPGCDPGLAQLCLDLLAKDPAQRPSASETQERLLLLAGEDAELPPPPVPQPRSPGLLGREQELVALRAAWAQAAERPRLLWITGESGSGKSALAGELLEQLQAEGVQAWFGPCFEREHVPYKAFDAVVDALVVALSSLPEEEVFRLLPPGTPSLVRLFPVLREVSQVAQLDHETTLRDPQAERQRALRALFALLANLGQGRPPLLLLDDLQRADAESLQVLEWLADAEEAPPCLVLGTYRDEEVPQEHPLRGLALRSPRVDALQLPPLARPALERIVSAYAAVSLSESQRLQLAEEAQGNPFLAVELARAVRPDRAGEAPSLAELVARRVSELDGRERGVFDAITVAAGPAAFGLLVQVSGLAPAALADALDELQRLELVHEVPGGRGEAFGLTHDRLREAAYLLVPAARRRELHHALAAELASLDEAARAVAHWHLADEPAKAREAALEAAREAESQLAFRRAAELYGLAGESGAGSWELTAARGRALAKAGLHHEAAASFEQAVRGAPPEEARELELQAVSSLFSAGDPARAIALLNVMLGRYRTRVAPSGGLRCLRVPIVVWHMLTLALTCGFMWLKTRLGLPRAPLTDDVLFQLRLYDAARHHLTILDPSLALDSGLRHAYLSERYEHVGHRGRARVAEAFLFGGLLGRLASSLAHRLLHQGEALCGEAEDAEGLLQGQVVRSYLLLLQHNYIGVQRTAQAAERLAQRAGLYGDPNLMTLHTLHTGSRVFAGELPSVVRVAGDYLADARLRGSVPELSQNLAALGSALLAQGQREASGCAFAEALEVTPAEPYTIPRVQVELLAAQLDMYDGDPGPALARIEAVRQRWRRDRLVVTSMEKALFRLLRGRCRMLLRRQGAPACSVTTEWWGLTWWPAPSSLRDEVLRLRAAYLAGSGRLHAALKLVERAVRLGERHNHRWGLGVALAARASLRRRLGLPGAALDATRSAEVLGEIGAPGCYLIRVEGWEDR